MKYVEVDRSLVVATRVTSLELPCDQKRFITLMMIVMKSKSLDNRPMTKFAFHASIIATGATNLMIFAKKQHLLNSLLWEAINITQKSEEQVG